MIDTDYLETSKAAIFCRSFLNNNAGMDWSLMIQNNIKIKDDVKKLY
jgi:hypothetical protein